MGLKSKYFLFFLIGLLIGGGRQVFFLDPPLPLLINFLARSTSIKQEYPILKQAGSPDFQRRLDCNEVMTYLEVKELVKYIRSHSLMFSSNEKEYLDLVEMQGKFLKDQAPDHNLDKFSLECMKK